LSSALDLSPPQRYNRAMRQTNRWHPCLLPENYQRKLKQDLAEADNVVETDTKREAVEEVEHDESD
jgi:hypothetical protein